MLVLRVCAVVAVLAAWLGGCATVDDSNARWVDELSDEQLTPQAYKIRGNDKLQVTVFKQESLSGEAVVREDGFITVPLVNDVRVAGMTPMEAGDEIARKLSGTGFIDKPAVSVAVLETRAPTFAVVGQVKQPGSFELQPGTTVLDGIALAGGLDEFADKQRIFVIRKRANVAPAPPAPPAAPSTETPPATETPAATPTTTPTAATPTTPTTTSTAALPQRVRFSWQKLSQSTGKALQFHVEDGDVIVVE